MPLFYLCLQLFIRGTAPESHSWTLVAYNRFKWRRRSDGRLCHILHYAALHGVAFLVLIVYNHALFADSRIFFLLNSRARAHRFSLFYSHPRWQSDDHLFR